MAVGTLKGHVSKSHGKGPFLTQRATVTEPLLTGTRPWLSVTGAASPVIFRSQVCSKVRQSLVPLA